MPALTDPAVHLTLLLLSLACLGLWIATYKWQARTWRFELFAIDFALGAFLLSALAGLTLGNLGTDLPFSDRLIVSSNTSLALMFAAGCFFGLGNTLLLGAVSLLGVADSFALSGGLALAIGFGWHASGSPPFLLALALFLAGALLAVVAGRLSDPAVPKTPPLRGQRPAPFRLRRSSKGFLVACLGGVALGVSFPVAMHGAFDEFALGPYAGAFIFCLGVLLSNVVFSLYFFNIALEGGALPLKSYLQDWPRKHLPGLLGGAVWSVGALTFLLDRSSLTLGVIPNLSPYWEVAALPLVMALGLFVWRESRATPRLAAILLQAALLVFVAGCAALILS